MNIFLKQTKALADGSRLRITAALFQYPELCVCQITELLGLATATVSRHISVLRNASLVESRKDGRWIYYRLSDDFPRQLRQWIKKDLLPSRQIQQDQARLHQIASCSLEEICRKNRDSGSRPQHSRKNSKQT